MHKKIILLLFISVVLHAEQEIPRDLLTIVLMVKNEEAAIVDTLEPFVMAGLDAFLIFDTGSTDNTIAVATDFFNKHHVQRYVILQEPFIDFATSRNRALDLAEEQFPDSIFFLMPDAEWYTHNVKGLIDFCIAERDQDITSYLMRITNPIIDFCVPRLIRGKSHARFIGVVHEIIPSRVIKKLPNDVYFELGSSEYGSEKSRKRWERDLGLLIKEYEKHPHCSRTTFYLAQTYECLNDAYNAYRYYKLRSEQPGWPEENYETFYRLGYTAEYLSFTDPHYTWDMAYRYYSIAHKISPHRVEPLVRIAEHYWAGGSDASNIPLCYLFARRACELAYPEHDCLFINPYFYTFKRYELFSNAALIMQDFENGEAATRIALSICDLPHLQNNLAAYIKHRTQVE